MTAFLKAGHGSVPEGWLTLSRDAERREFPFFSDVSRNAANSFPQWIVADIYRPNLRDGRPRMSQDEPMENAPLSESDEILCTRMRQLTTASTLTQSRRDQINDLIRTGTGGSQPDPATAAEQNHQD